jgi:hypothetical protein
MLIGAGIFAIVGGGTGVVLASVVYQQVPLSLVSCFSLAFILPFLPVSLSQPCFDPASIASRSSLVC